MGTAVAELTKNLFQKREGRIKGKKCGGRRREQLPNNIEETKRYWKCK
jgi:hypothetical protein